MVIAGLEEAKAREEARYVEEVIRLGEALANDWQAATERAEERMRRLSSLRDPA